MPGRSIARSGRAPRRRSLDARGRSADASLAAGGEESAGAAGHDATAQQPQGSDDCHRSLRGASEPPRDSATPAPPGRRTQRTLHSSYSASGDMRSGKSSSSGESTRVEHVLFECVDQGVGMSPEALSKLFMPFSQPVRARQSPSAREAPLPSSHVASRAKRA